MALKCVLCLKAALFTSPSQSWSAAFIPPSYHKYLSEIIPMALGRARQRCVLNKTWELVLFYNPAWVLESVSLASHWVGRSPTPLGPCSSQRNTELIHGARCVPHSVAIHHSPHNPTGKHNGKGQELLLLF